MSYRWFSMTITMLDTSILNKGFFDNNIIGVNFILFTPIILLSIEENYAYVRKYARLLN